MGSHIAAIVLKTSTYIQRRRNLPISRWICTHLKSSFWKFTMLWKAVFSLLFLVNLSSANLFDGNWTFPFRFPSFDDFFGLNTLLPILNWESPVSGIQIHILNNTNQSVRLNCSWLGKGNTNVNLTWFIGESKAEEGQVEQEQEGLLLNMDWENTNHSVTFTCRGQASEPGWMGESVASEILMPGVSLPPLTLDGTYLDATGDATGKENADNSGTDSHLVDPRP